MWNPGGAKAVRETMHTLLDEGQERPRHEEEQLRWFPPTLESLDDWGGAWEPQEHGREAAPL